MPRRPMPEGQRINVLPLLLPCGAAAAYALTGTLPVIGYAVLLILIAGTMYRTARSGPGMGIIAALAAAMTFYTVRRLAFGTVETVLFVSYLTEAAVAAVLAGTVLYRGGGALRALWTATAAPVALSLLLVTGIGGLRPLYEAPLDAVTAVYAENISSEAGAEALVALEQTMTITRRVFPGVMFAASAMTLVMGYLLLQAFCRRRGYALPLLPPVRYWRLPFWPVWIFAAGMAGALWGTGMVQDAALNAVVAAAGLYLTAGFAVLRYMLALRRLPVFFEYATYLLLLSLMPFSGMALALLGLFDIWFDFRKLNTVT